MVKPKKKSRFDNAEKMMFDITNWMLSRGGNTLCQQYDLQDALLEALDSKDKFKLAAVLDVLEGNGYFDLKGGFEGAIYEHLMERPPHGLYIPWRERRLG